MNILTTEQWDKVEIAYYDEDSCNALRVDRGHYEGLAERLLKAQVQETLKMVLDIVNKHWAGYCDFEDKRACLEILENIQDDIEALTQSGEE